MKHIENAPCEYCKEILKAGDDIVVCPECGSPYHRSCFTKARACIHTAEHGTYFWQSPIKVVEEKPATVRCGRCGEQAPVGTELCGNCGYTLASSQNIDDTKETQDANSAQEPQNGAFRSSTTQGSHQQAGSADFTPMGGFPFAADDGWSVNSVSAQELSIYMGGSAYGFMRRFKRLLQNTHKISWNWSSFLFTYFYLFYRKLYGIAIGVTAITLIVSLPSFLYTNEYFKLITPELSATANLELMNMLEPYLDITMALNIVIMVLCGLFTDRFILKKSIEDILDIRKLYDGEVMNKEYLSSLYFLGRPSMFAVLGVLAVIYAASNIFTALLL